MNILVVTFGDSYERVVVGLARDLNEARTVAEVYRARFSFPGWFEFEPFVLGEVGSRAPAEELELVHNLG